MTWLPGTLRLFAFEAFHFSLGVFGCFFSPSNVVSPFVDSGEPPKSLFENPTSDVIYVLGAFYASAAVACFGVRNESKASQ